MVAKANRQHKERGSPAAMTLKSHEGSGKRTRFQDCHSLASRMQGGGDLLRDDALGASREAGDLARSLMAQCRASRPCAVRPARALTALRGDPRSGRLA